jgi:hypothetical protein
VSTTSDVFENISDDDELWLADIETMTMNLGQELSAWREARQRALADDDFGPGDDLTPPDERMSAAEEMSADEQSGPSRSDRTHHDRPASSIRAATIYPAGMGEPRAAGRQPGADQRTRSLIDHGRRTARPPRRSRRRAVTVAVILVALIATALVILVFRHGASWPTSVATVQSEITTACQNPDVASEPDQVNFACEKSTSQILWVFSLMTTGDNPAFSDTKSGREGLEPITPAMGGEVAWSLNLHHPYNPLNPIDSLAVAARAINNIVGGATITGGNGKLTVQPGLESNPTNCARYTGSSAVIARAGFPDICAQPISSGTGQAALVSDIYEQWLVGSPPAAAQEASVLFENANNPGNPMVQAILRTLPAAYG